MKIPTWLLGYTSCIAYKEENKIIECEYLIDYKEYIKRFPKSKVSRKQYYAYWLMNHWFEKTVFYLAQKKTEEFEKITVKFILKNKTKIFEVTKEFHNKYTKEEFIKNLKETK